MGNTLQKLSQNQPFTCEICIKPMLLPNKKFHNQNLCFHPFCTDCIIKYITVKLDDNIGNIPCPYLNCNHFFDPVSCRKLLTPQLFVKWCDVLCESSISTVAQCYCPNRNCSALILDECCGGNAKKSKCPNCKTLFCFKCKVPWHARLSCEGNGDVAFHVLAKRKKWKRCPRCRHFVELNQGCKIVTCRCGGVFCYNCGRRVYDSYSCDCDHWCFTLFKCFMFPLVFLVFLFLYYISLRFIEKH